MSDPSWTVVVSGDAAGFAQQVTAGGHSLLSDEPATAGGSDTGPDPYGLLLAALGSCTSMTIGMYARRKQYRLDRVTVRLRHQREHVSDCSDCENPNPRRIDRIERVIELTGQLDDEERARLLDIASKCPVHRTLVGEIRIDTRLA